MPGFLETEISGPEPYEPYLEVHYTYNLLSNCSYNPIISRVTVVMGFIIWVITTVTKQVISTMNLQVNPRVSEQSGVCQADLYFDALFDLWSK